MGHSRLRETRAIYSMANEASHARTRAKQISIPTPWRILNRRAAIGAAVIVFLLVTSWAAIPASSNNRAVEPGPPSPKAAVLPQASRPQLTPLPGFPDPLPLPILATEIVEATAHTTAPSVHPATPQHSRHGLSPESSNRKRHTADFPDHTPTPRAGRLSVSDFW